MAGAEVSDALWGKKKKYRESEFKSEDIQSTSPAYTKHKPQTSAYGETKIQKM